MTKIIYVDNLEEYIRVIIKQEILGEYEGCILKYQPKEKYFRSKNEEKNKKNKEEKK